MPDTRGAVERRTVVKTIAGAVTAVGLAGRATATSGRYIEVNVGYETEEARRAVLDAAVTVIEEFPFDAMTVELTRRDAIALSKRDDIRYVERNREMPAFEAESTSVSTR